MDNQTLQKLFQVQIFKIIQAWSTYLKNETSDIAVERSKHCVDCPEAVVGTFEKFMPDKTLQEIEGLKCNICKCPLSTKLRSEDASEKCPLKKW